jgi:hypothetical protein
MCSNVVAYTASTTPPMPFRFKSSNIRFQVPDLGFGTLMQRVDFIKKVGESAAWRTLATTYHTLKTWMRRSVWGDRVRKLLFLLAYCHVLTNAAILTLRRSCNIAPAVACFAPQRRPHAERCRRDCRQPAGCCTRRCDSQDQGGDQGNCDHRHNTTASPNSCTKHSQACHHTRGKDRSREASS